MVNSRRGRPRGQSQGRQKLLAVALERYEAGDLVSWSTRQLAASAGVSHSLVNYYFGGRQGLLTAAYALTIAPHEVIAASRDGDGVLDPVRLIRGLVAVWENPEHRRALGGFARQAIAGDTRDTLADYLQHAVLDVLVEDLGLDRGRRLAVTIAGTVMTRYLLEVPGMSRLPAPELVRLMRVTAGC
ncbi:TetR family transcriptional regulator [Pseudactinotalea sp.]|uniref:TetR/AcrR family transcriptional regulator n=1 Tax=Pseudactinotalea sp. TaxID=1926260 RepID=UPI003B3B9258